MEGDIHRNYKQLDELTRRMANALAARGLKMSDRIGTLARKCYRHIRLYYAASGSGAVLHNINPRLHPDQTVYRADHAENAILFFDPSFLPLVEAIAPRARPLGPSSR